MLKFSQDSKVDFEQYEENIGATGSRVLVDYNKFMDIIDDLSARMESMRLNCGDKMSVMSNRKYDKPTPKKIVGVLTEYCNINKDWLYDYKSKGLSGAIPVLTEVLRKLKIMAEEKKASYLHQQAIKIIELYIEFRELQSAVGASNKVELMGDTSPIGWGGAELAELPFVYEQRATARYYTMNDNIQGWNGLLKQSLTEKKDWYLWWGDFEQIDLRVFLNSLLLQGDPKFREVMNAYPDKYEAFTRYMYSSISKLFDKEYFTANRQKFKAGALASLYGISEASLTAKLNGDSSIAKIFTEFFANNPAYKKFLNSIEDAIRLGLGLTMRDYFGVERTVETYGDAPTPRNINQALNIPTQCGSNSIVVLWTNAVMEKFRQMGFGKDKVYVYLNRHDEIVIAMHKDVFPAAWILKDAAKIQVDDWDLLTMEYGMGVYYAEEDKAVMDKFEEICTKHQSEFTTVPVGEHHNFVPVKPVIKAYMYSGLTPGSFLKMLKLPMPSGVLKDAELLKIIEDYGRNQGGSAASMCRDYVMYYGQISFRDATTNKWRFRVPLSELILQDIYGAIIYNATASNYEYIGSKAIRFIAQGAEKITNMLDNNIEMDFLQYEKKSNSNGYVGKNSYQESSKYSKMSDIMLDPLDISFDKAEAKQPKGGDAESIAYFDLGSEKDAYSSGSDFEEYTASTRDERGESGYGDF